MRSVETLSVENQKGAIALFNNAPLRTRWALSLYNVYGNSSFLVLNGTSLNSVLNARLALSRRL